MTHDELLAKLWIIPADVTELQHGAKAVQALRAIVELHKPTNDGMCGKCLGLAADWVTYPCATIQAIERELT